LHDITNANTKIQNHSLSLEEQTTSNSVASHFDSHLNFDRHISNVCFSFYFHIRALRQIRAYLDSETSKTIACAIVGFRLHYANSVLTGISARNIHRLQRVKNSLARVVTRSTTNSTSALTSLHWLPIRQRIDYKLATIVHRSLQTLALNICHLCYTSPMPQHVSFAPPPSIFSPNLVPRLLSPLVVFGLLAPPFGTPSLLILDLSAPTPPSNPISKLTCSVLQAFLVPDNPCASD